VLSSSSTRLCIVLRHCISHLSLSHSSLPPSRPARVRILATMKKIPHAGRDRIGIKNRDSCAWMMMI